MLDKAQHVQPETSKLRIRYENFIGGTWRPL
jgi:hypothetical protein